MEHTRTDKRVSHRRMGKERNGRPLLSSPLCCIACRPMEAIQGKAIQAKERLKSRAKLGAERSEDNQTTNRFVRVSVNAARMSVLRSFTAQTGTKDMPRQTQQQQKHTKRCDFIGKRTTNKLKKMTARIPKMGRRQLRMEWSANHHQQGSRREGVS